jgi:pimeloyl-ACP methyl ester carboxylesterase
MPFVQTPEVNLRYAEHGNGDQIALFIHGNLGCMQWMDLVWDYLPPALRVIAVDWRGCGDSDKPAPAPDYSNYSMSTHARDLLALLDALDISKCDLICHSTGGIISTHMLQMQPARFGKVLALDPVGPMGLTLTPGAIDLFKAMKSDRSVAAFGLASAAPTLFDLSKGVTPVTGGWPEYNATATPMQRALFELIVDKTRLLSDGIWFGTAHNLNLERENGALRGRQESILHPHLVLWGEFDQWIPREDVEEMARRMPNCQLVVVPGVGHSLNLEKPTAFAQYIRDFLLA